jgi:hypothetical protein
MQPAFGKDGHYLFGEVVGVRYWLPAVEKFFAKHHIAFEPIQELRLAGAIADARDVALRECRNISGAACALYAVDSEVVWKAPEAEVVHASTKPSGAASTGSR